MFNILRHLESVLKVTESSIYFWHAMMIDIAKYLEESFILPPVIGPQLKTRYFSIQDDELLLYIIFLVRITLSQYRGLNENP